MKQSIPDESVLETRSTPSPAAPPSPSTPQFVHMPSKLVGRVTGIVGLVFLTLGFFLWFVRNGHYRLILLVLTVAMFMAILHTYTFENGGK